MAYSKIILNGETLMDVTSDTVTADKMLSGIKATKNDGTKATGSIATKSSTDLTASGATVTAPSGYYASSASKSVATTTHPNPTASVNSSTGVVTASHTQGTGYVTGGTTTGTLNLTTKAAATYYPSASDQSIASNRWLTGAQTIKAVTTSNLTAANIKNGTVVKVGDSANASRIAQVTGTLKEGVAHTARISGGGNSSNCYVQYNGTKYYTEGQTFTFYDGDTIYLYVYGPAGSYIQFGGGKYSETGAATYSYTAIGCNTDFKLVYDQLDESCIEVNFINSDFTNYRPELALDYTTSITPTSQIQYINPPNNCYGFGTFNVKAASAEIHRVSIRGTGNIDYCFVEAPDGSKYYTEYDYFDVDNWSSIGVYYKGTLYSNGSLVESASSYKYQYFEVIDNDVIVTLDYGNDNKTVDVRKQVTPYDTLHISDTTTSYNVYNYAEVDFADPITAVVSYTGNSTKVYMRDEYYTKYYTKGDIYTVTDTRPNTLYFTVNRGSTSNYIYYNGEIIAGGEGEKINDFQFTLTKSVTVQLNSDSSNSTIEIYDTNSSFQNKVVHGTFKFNQGGNHWIGIPYSGEGYPIIVTVNVKDGVDANQEWKALDQKYAVGEYTNIKLDFSTAPTYGSSSSDSPSHTFFGYKSIAGSPLTMAYSGNYNSYFYNGTTNTSYFEQCVSFGSKNVMSVYTNSYNATTPYNCLAVGIEYEFTIVYSS